MSKRGGYHISDQFASHFLTFTVVGWIDLFTRKQCKDIIIDSMKYCQKYKGLIIQAYVIMPSHLHVIWKAKEDSQGLSNIIRDFKRHTSKSLIDWILTNKKESRSDWMEMVLKYHAKFNKNNKKYQLWKRSNRPVMLLYPKFIFQKLYYIHQNPVVAGIVKHQEDYLYSSAATYMESEKESLLSVEIIDFGSLEGFVMT